MADPPNTSTCACTCLTSVSKSLQRQTYHFAEDVRQRRRNGRRSPWERLWERRRGTRVNSDRDRQRRAVAARAPRAGRSSCRGRHRRLLSSNHGQSTEDSCFSRRGRHRLRAVAPRRPPPRSNSRRETAPRLAPKGFRGVPRGSEGFRGVPKGSEGVRGGKRGPEGVRGGP